MYKNLRECYQELLDKYNLLKTNHMGLIKQNKNLQKEVLKLEGMLNNARNLDKKRS